VILWIIAALAPASWHPATLFIGGVALLAISEWLTPCQDQITRWWRDRISR